MHVYNKKKLYNLIIYDFCWQNWSWPKHNNDNLKSVVNVSQKGRRYPLYSHFWGLDSFNFSLRNTEVWNCLSYSFCPATSREIYHNLIKINPFISLSICFLLLVKGSNATPFKIRSGDLLSWPFQFIDWVYLIVVDTHSLPHCTEAFTRNLLIGQSITGHKITRTFR